jgi:surface polysaccharide O-acyltransferase-like enzyme
MVSKTEDIQWLDSLRALAMLGVILIHVSTPVVKMIYGKNMEYWWIGNIADSAVRFSVPLFLMLSGATMLGKEYKLDVFYKRRFSRVLVPFLFWLVVYWIYNWIILIPKLQPHEFHNLMQWVVNLFLKEGVSKHFWYIYMILFIYLFVPFIGKGVRRLKESFLIYLLLGWLILSLIFKSTPLNLYNWSSDYISKFFGYFLYTGYLVLGYYLSKLPVITIKKKIYSSVLFILSIIISAVFTYMLSKKANQPDLSEYGYLTINTVIQSISVFLLIKDSTIKNRLVSKIQNSVSNYSYGIYLVHVLVLGVYFNNGIFWTMAHPLISLPLVTLMTLLTSFIIIYILRKIPFGKYISG